MQASWLSEVGEQQSAKPPEDVHHSVNSNYNCKLVTIAVKSALTKYYEQNEQKLFEEEKL